MTPQTQDKLLQDLRELLRDFNGKEYSGPIDSRTLLFADLGLVSIDAVVLAETLEGMYQRQFAFDRFLAAMGRQGIRDVQLGWLIDFLCEEMATPTAAVHPCP